MHCKRFPHTGQNSQTLEKLYYKICGEKKATLPFQRARSGVDYIVSTRRFKFFGLCIVFLKISTFYKRKTFPHAY